MLIYADKGCLHDHVHREFQTQNVLKKSPSNFAFHLPRPLPLVFSSPCAAKRRSLKPSRHWPRPQTAQTIGISPQFRLRLVFLLIGKFACPTDPKLADVWGSIPDFCHINPMTNSPLSVKEVWPIYQSGHKTKHRGLTTSKPYHLRQSQTPILHVPQSHIPCLWTCPSICPCL